MKVTGVPEFHEVAWRACFFLSLLLFNKGGIAAEPSFMVNIPQYWIRGALPNPYPSTEQIYFETDYLPCTGSIESCLTQSFQNWVQISGAEGYTLIDEKEYNCCVTRLMRYYNHEFDLIKHYNTRNIPGTMGTKHDFFAQISDFITGEILFEQYGVSGLHFAFKILSCTNPKYPKAVDADFDGIAEICYKDVIAPCQIESDERQKDAKDKSGDPILCSSGQSIQKDHIYVDSGADPLSFSLNYITPVYADESDDPSCPALRSNYNQSITKVLDRNDLLVYQVNYGSPSHCNVSDIASGFSYIFFSEREGVFQSNGSNAKSFALNVDGSMVETRKRGSVTHYNASGQVSRRQSKGNLKTYAYTPSGKIKTIRNQYGKELVFTYNSNDLMDSLLTPEGHTYHFEYDMLNNMTEVVFPDSTPADSSDNPTIQYVYENPDFPRHMTGKINENGQRYASWTFDSKGRAKQQYQWSRSGKSTTRLFC